MAPSPIGTTLRGRLSERRAVWSLLAVGIYGAIAAAFLIILILAPDEGPSLGPGLQVVGLASSFAAPGVAVAIGRFDSDLQAVMGGTVIVSSIAAGLGGSIILPFGLVAGLALLVGVRGALSIRGARLALATVVGSAVVVAAYGFSLRADLLGTVAGVLLSTGLVLIAPRLLHAGRDSST